MRRNMSATPRCAVFAFVLWFWDRGGWTYHTDNGPVPCPVCSGKNWHCWVPFPVQRQALGFFWEYNYPVLTWGLQGTAGISAIAKTLVWWLETFHYSGVSWFTVGRAGFLLSRGGSWVTRPVRLFQIVILTLLLSLIQIKALSFI